jgi:hypothetical protein
MKTLTVAQQKLATLCSIEGFDTIDELMEQAFSAWRTRLPHRRHLRPAAGGAREPDGYAALRPCAPLLGGSVEPHCLVLLDSNYTQSWNVYRCCIILTALLV